MLLIEAWRGQQLVQRCCARAQAEGVRPGMRLAHARALLSADAVTVRAHEPRKDAARLTALARWAQRFTPIATADVPDGLLLDMTGCERLYGGASAMLERVAAEVRRLGLTVRAAMAPTVGCAWAVARFEASAVAEVPADAVRARLAPLPIQALRVDESVARALGDVAIDRVEHLLALPRESLHARFGEALLRRLDQALGYVDERLAAPGAPAPIEAARAFAGPVTQLAAVQQTVRELLTALTAQLRRAGRGARRLRLTVTRLDGRLDVETTRQDLTLSRPGRDADHLWKLLSPRIETLSLGRGVQQLALSAPHTSALPHAQHAWLAARACDEPGEPDGSRALGALIDRLVSRLGEAHVCFVEPVGTHVPERAFAWRSAASEGAGRDVEMEVEGEASARLCRASPVDRPSRLYASPEPVDVTLLSPDGPVVRMRGRSGVCSIRTSIGPERVTPRWWVRGAARQTPPARDYFKVQDESGRWWWLYRQAGTASWFVHGVWV